MTVGDCDEIAVLQANLEHQKQEAEREITTLTSNFQSQITKIESTSAQILSETKEAHARQVTQMEESHR